MSYRDRDFIATLFKTLESEFPINDNGKLLSKNSETILECLHELLEMCIQVSLA
jgi:hypothetical protein